MNDNTYRDTLIGAGLGGAAGIGANIFANPKDEDDEDDEGRSMWGDVGAGMTAGGLIGAGVNQYTGGEYGGAAAPYEALAPNSPLQPGPASPAPGPLDVDAITNELIGNDAAQPQAPIPYPAGPAGVAAQNADVQAQLEASDGEGDRLQEYLDSDAAQDTPIALEPNVERVDDGGGTGVIVEDGKYMQPRPGGPEGPTLPGSSRAQLEYEDMGWRDDPRDPYGPSIVSKAEYQRLRDLEFAAEYNEDDRLKEYEDAVEAQQRYDGRNRTADDPAPATGQGKPALQENLPLGVTDVVSGQTGTSQGGPPAAIGAPGSDPATQPVNPLALPEEQGGNSRRIKELLGVLESTPNDRDALAELKATPSIANLASQITSLRTIIDQQSGQGGSVGDLPDRLKRAEAMWAEATGGHLEPGSQLATKEGAVASMARTNWAPEESHEEARHKALEFGALMAKRAMGYKESGSYAKKKKKKKGNRRKVLIDPDGKAKHRPYEDDDEEKKAHLQSIISQGTARFLGREEKQAKRNEGPGQGYAPAPQGGRGMMLTRGMERKLNNPNKSIDTARVTKRLHKGKNKMSPTPRRLREDMPVGQGSTPNPFK